MRTALCTALAAAGLALAQMTFAGDEPDVPAPQQVRPARAVEVDPKEAMSDRDKLGRGIESEKVPAPAPRRTPPANEK
jgi:hypothetical protein